MERDTDKLVLRLQNQTQNLIPVCGRIYLLHKAGKPGR
jgi:hypothetical protein